MSAHFEWAILIAAIWVLLSSSPKMFSGPMGWMCRIVALFIGILMCSYFLAGALATIAGLLRQAGII